jgi:membrane fusion protein, heavy metal efflux system
MTPSAPASRSEQGLNSAPPQSGQWPAAPSDRRLLRLVGKALLLVAVCAGAAFLVRRYPTQVTNVWRSLTGARSPKLATTPSPPPTLGGHPWDGFITLPEEARAAMGIAVEEAKPQTEPIRLELLGTTEYISDTLTKVRPMFKGRVDKVHATVGQSVTKGDALIDLFSTQLAEAKGAYEIERIQWVYDKNLLEIRKSLLQSHSISQQLYDETKNNEMKNRREYEVARDNLFVYGLSEEEVERVEQESSSQKARLTLRSPIDGMVITRDVVAGNLYDENDTLLVIAPLDRLWVWGNVFESDLDLVKPGQAWEIRFPFLSDKLRGKVEYISNRVDPGTHAVRVRTSIPNVDGKLKSDMLVRGMLEVPPVPGHVVIPRAALVVADRQAYVFVQLRGEPGKYERHWVSIAQEKDDHAVIAQGLTAGDEVVTIGGLILAQIYEDLHIAKTGMPSSGRPDSG